MSGKARKIAELIHSARRLGNRGEFEEASLQYYEAHQLASDFLLNPKLAFICKHNALIERLADVRGKDTDIIQDIIENLAEMRQGVEDDRIDQQVTPLIRYFSILKCAQSDDIKGLSEVIEQGYGAESGVSCYDLVANVLLHTLQVLEHLRAFHSAPNASREKLEEIRTGLIESVNSQLQHNTIPKLIVDILRSFSYALRQAGNREAVERAIKQFHDSLVNHNHKALRFAIEIMKPALGEIVDAYGQSGGTLDLRNVQFVAGLVFSAVTFVVLGVLAVTVALFNLKTGPGTAGVIACFAGFGAACGLGFIRGKAQAKGSLELPAVKGVTLNFDVAGGTGAFVIVACIVFLLLKSG